mgnify:CR=1 FL=1
MQKIHYIFFYYTSLKVCTLLQFFFSFLFFPPPFEIQPHFGAQYVLQFHNSFIDLSYFFYFFPYSLNIILSSFFSFFSILMQTHQTCAHLHYTKRFPQSCLLSLRFLSFCSSCLFWCCKKREDIKDKREKRKKRGGK